MANDKVAIIMAGGSGMGAVAARRLASDGFHVGVLSSSGQGEALATELGGIGVTGSNQSESDLKALVDQSVERWGRIDVLVNSAGHGPRAPILELSDEDWHTGLEVYFLNVVRATRLVTHVMQQQRSGAIINISTFAAFEPDLVLRCARGGGLPARRDRTGAWRRRAGCSAMPTIGRWAAGARCSQAGSAAPGTAAVGRARPQGLPRRSAAVPLRRTPAGPRHDLRSDRHREDPASPRHPPSRTRTSAAQADACESAVHSVRRARGRQRNVARRAGRSGFRVGWGLYGGSGFRTYNGPNSRQEPGATLHSPRNERGNSIGGPKKTGLNHLPAHESKVATVFPSVDRIF